MRLTRLDLLRQGMDVAEASLERGAGEDRRSAGGLVDVVGDLDRRSDRVGATEPHAQTGMEVDRGDVIGGSPYVFQDLDQPRTGGTKLSLPPGDVGLHDGTVGETQQVARRFVHGQGDERI